jgi:hypothetical protein
VADDASLPVLEAAIAVAQDEYPQLDSQTVLAEIDALADTLRRRIPADAAPLQRLRLLNRYFFQELASPATSTTTTTRATATCRGAGDAARHPHHAWRCCTSNWPRRPG